MGDMYLIESKAEDQESYLYFFQDVEQSLKAIEESKARLCILGTQCDELLALADDGTYCLGGCRVDRETVH
jgi:hypothetical protein